MANVLVLESSLEDIADAIREKNGTQNTYKPGEMGDAIREISGGNVTVEALSVTQNGTYTAQEGEAYSPVTVNVSGGSATLIDKNINANGTYNASDDSADGYKKVVVNVPQSVSGYAWRLIESKTIALSEYTDTSTAEQTDTGIDLSNTDYAFIFVIVTCDSAITTPNEWGMSIIPYGRFVSSSSSHGRLSYSTTYQQKGVEALSIQNMVNSTFISANVGVYGTSNTTKVILNRKCHATNMPKIRGGNYTVAAYGLVFNS